MNGSVASRCPESTDKIEKTGEKINFDAILSSKAANESLKGGSTLFVVSHCKAIMDFFICDRPIKIQFKESLATTSDNVTFSMLVFSSSCLIHLWTLRTI
jgi:hypothetical protein